MGLDETLVYLAADKIAGLDSSFTGKLYGPGYNNNHPQTGGGTQMHFTPPFTNHCVCSPWIDCYCGATVDYVQTWSEVGVRPIPQDRLEG